MKRRVKRAGPVIVFAGLAVLASDCANETPTEPVRASLTETLPVDGDSYLDSIAPSVEDENFGSGIQMIVDQWSGLRGS
jgi:hypothetical protein